MLSEQGDHLTLLIAARPCLATSRLVAKRHGCRGFETKNRLKTCKLKQMGGYRSSQPPAEGCPTERALPPIQNRESTGIPKQGGQLKPDRLGCQSPSRASFDGGSSGLQEQSRSRLAKDRRERGRRGPETRNPHRCLHTKQSEGEAVEDRPFVVQSRHVHSRPLGAPSPVFLDL